MKRNMFRNLTLAILAAAALGAAALAPTSASAWGGGWHHHHRHGGWHRGWYGTGFGYVGGYDCYYVKRLIDTPYGLRTKRVLVCN